MLVDLNQISKEVRTEVDAPLDEIKKIYSYMFKCVSDTMKEGKFESVYLQYLGTFRVKPNRLFFLKRKGLDIGVHGERILERLNSKKDG